MGAAPTLLAIGSGVLWRLRSPDKRRPAIGLAAKNRGEPRAGGTSAGPESGRRARPRAKGERRGRISVRRGRKRGGPWSSELLPSPRQLLHAPLLHRLHVPRLAQLHRPLLGGPLRCDRRRVVRARNEIPTGVRRAVGLGHDAVDASGGEGGDDALRPHREGSERLRHLQQEGQKILGGPVGPVRIYAVSKKSIEKRRRGSVSSM